MSTTTSLAAGPAELAALKLLALSGARSGEVQLSCSELAERLDASDQTASRRLQALAGAGLVEREVAGDGQWVRVTEDGERALRREYEQYRRIFEEPGVVELTGTATGGMGEGRHYISLPGYMSQFRERLGYEPFPGTLNVELTDGSVRRRSAMESLDAVPIDGWEDEDRTYGPAVCYPAAVSVGTPGAADADNDEGGTDDAGDEGGTDDAGDDAGGTGATYEGAHVIEPERTHHDDDQLELIAPDKLRDELGIEDDDHLTVSVGGR